MRGSSFYIVKNGIRIKRGCVKQPLIKTELELSLRSFNFA